jgi:hypothetical protein
MAIPAERGREEVKGVFQYGKMIAKPQAAEIGHRFHD